MDDSVEERQRESTKSEKLDTNYENQLNVSGSNEGVTIRGDVSVVDKSKDDPIPESSNSPSSVPSKGKGLRKWRRIKRDVIKDGSGSVDPNKSGKRGLSNSAPNPIRGQKSEDSLSSTDAIVRNLENKMNGSILETKLVSGISNSEISEDQSSISSTAASGSVMMKGFNGVRARAKIKKARGEREKIEKENSITSSLESDSRSSNFVFTQGTDSGANNGIYREKIGNGDEARDDEKCIVDEVENGGDLEDLADNEKQGSVELDPLAESISELQSAQEALEKEIQKFKELGEEEAHYASSSQLFNLTKNTEISTHYLKAHVNTLKQNVEFSEKKLEEANGILEAKATKFEYELIEAEIEDLFKRKLEKEFQYLVISKTLENLKVDEGGRVAVSDELKRRAEKLETRVGATIGAEEVSKLQKSVRQVTSCFFFQFVLLFIVFISFVLNLSPDNTGVVPT